MSMAALPVGSSTPRTSRQPSACSFASEVRSAGVSVDAAVVAFVCIAAEPIVIAVSGAHIGLERGMEPIQRPALHSRGPWLRGRCRGGMRYVAPVAMMTRRGVLGRPRRGLSEDGGHRDHQTNIAPHK